MTDDQLREVVPRVLRGVRTFSKDFALATEIGRLRTHLKSRSILALIENVHELQAVSLIFDYEESRGDAVNDTVSKVGEELVRSGVSFPERHQKANTGDLRWCRQIVWVLMAYALWLHRHNNLTRMSVALDTAKEILDKYLIPSKLPFIGTLCRYAYYRGLQYRDQGDLESATECFQESFEKAQERTQVVALLRSRNPQDPKVLEEERFSRCCMGRVQAYGFGEIAFLRGDLAGAQAWFHTALVGLEASGLERWRLSVKVYLDGSVISMSPFSQTGVAQIEQTLLRLATLAHSLEPQHKAYAELARTFHALGRLRLKQMSSTTEGSEPMPITVDLPPRLLDEVAELSPSRHVDEVFNHGQPVRRHGAMSSLIALMCSELFMRGGRAQDCRTEIEWIRKQFQSSVYVQVEADLIEAQLMASQRDWKGVIDLLEHRSHELHTRANRNQRTLWYALASLACRETHEGRSLSAAVFAQRANELNQRVRHGFINYFAQSVVRQMTLQNPILFPMPYQAATPIFSLRDNEDAAIDNTLRAVTAFHPTVSSREELINIVGYHKSTLYAKRHQKHIERWLDESLHRSNAGA